MVQPASMEPDGGGSGPGSEYLATVGFASRSDVYERGRPGYPAEVVELLGDLAGLGPRCRVLDLAAGTGKLTRQLAATGAECVALDPSAAMREVASRVGGPIGVVGGLAESLPFADATFDLVTVAQAFHWFEPSSALAEMARVLRRNGTVALVWNERDDSVAWVADLGRIMLSVDGSVHAPAAGFVPVLESDEIFQDTARHSFAFTVSMQRAELVDLVASRSYVNVLGDPERATLLRRVRALAEGLPEPFFMPYVTQMLTGRKATSG